MALTFNLVQALNTVGTAGQAVFGAFKLGSIQGLNHLTFVPFNKYGYVGGTPVYVVGNPFNTTVELGWMMSPGTFNAYPHIGIENINGNGQIIPNLWNESIYIHPGRVNLTATDYLNVDARSAVIRFTVPANGNLSSIAGSFVKGDETFNVAAGFTILRNGIALVPRVVANSGDIIPISANTTVIAGDVIDFVVDMASDGLTSDDSAITLNLTLQLAVTPDPVVTGAINCTSTVITGIVPLVQSGAVSILSPTNTLLGTSVITPIPGTVNGQWSVSGLNLSNFGGQSLTITALDAPATISSIVSIPIGNVGCTTCIAPSISVNPVSATICSPNTHTFSVTAAGDGLTYQWKLANVIIPAATSSTYTTDVAGNYTVTVTGTCGTVTSSVAILTLNSLITGGGVQSPIIGVVGTLYTHTIVFSGVTPFTLGNIVTPVWLNITLLGDTVTVTGTPTIGDIGAADYSFDITNICGVRSTSSTGGTVNSATAVNDTVGNKPVGVLQTLNAATNDIACTSGITTWSLVLGSAFNVAINSFLNTGTITYTPLAVGPFSFGYNILCDGLVISTATVTGTATEICVGVSGGTINGAISTLVSLNEVYTVTGLIGTGPFTYLWTVGNGTILSGQATDNIVVAPTSNPLSIQCVVSNCSLANNVTLSKAVHVRTGCDLTIPVNVSCYTITNVVGYLQGVTEANRVTSFTSTSISFKSELGLRNYEFFIIDNFGLSHKIILKNIHC